MTNSQMMANVAKKLCAFLNEKGIKAESNFYPRQIDMTLRPSWYVKKAKEIGYTDCIYIEVKKCGFMAVLDNGDVMSGANFMIMDAFTCLSIDCGINEEKLQDFRAYFEKDYEEDLLVIATLPKIKKFLEGVQVTKREEISVPF